MPKILIPMAQGCEELEIVTIIDLLRRAQFDVVTASLESVRVEVVASRGVRLIADTCLDEALTQAYDAVVLAGGLPGADHLNNDDRIIDLVRNMAADGKWVAAVCAAPRVLAKAGVLEGRRATSYPGTLDVMDIPGMSYASESVVIDGNIVTSRGPGTTMEFALTLIELIKGRATREQVEGPLLRS